MRRRMFLLASVAGLASLAGLAFVGCFSTVKPRVANDPAQVAALRRFDDHDWAAVLAKSVDPRGRVDYGGLAADREALDRYVALIAEVGPKTRPALFPDAASRLAYYLNAYNALTLFNVLNRQPGLRSVNDDAKDFFYFTEFMLDGEAISLYHLENRVVRPLGEPRIHFALNCASAGCPRLPAEPFRAATLEAQLDRETAAFLHDPRNVTVEEGDLVLSQIFEWYAEDFAPNPPAWIRATAPDLDLPRDARVRHRDYDWSLNAQP